MIEEDAISWLRSRYPDKIEALGKFVALVTAEASRQNLVARSTLQSIWSRHIVDSAQLLSHAPDSFATWVDVGTGAGFPGLVIAIIRDIEFVMVEPRRLRVDFLRACVDQLGLKNARVERARVETLSDAFEADVVSARAVMPIDALFVATSNIRHDATRYILPRGASASTDLHGIDREWQGTFHVEPSVIDANSGIVIAEGVRRR